MLRDRPTTSVALTVVGDVVALNCVCERERERDRDRERETERERETCKYNNIILCRSVIRSSTLYLTFCCEFQVY